MVMVGMLHNDDDGDDDDNDNNDDNDNKLLNLMYIILTSILNTVLCSSLTL